VEEPVQRRLHAALRHEIDGGGTGQLQAGRGQGQGHRDQGQTCWSAQNQAKDDRGQVQDGDSGREVDPKQGCRQSQVTDHHQEDQTGDNITSQ